MCNPWMHMLRYVWKYAAKSDILVLERYHRGAHHRTGQRSAPGFVNTGDEGGGARFRHGKDSVRRQQNLLVPRIAPPHKSAAGL